MADGHGDQAAAATLISLQPQIQAVPQPRGRHAVCLPQGSDSAVDEHLFVAERPRLDRAILARSRQSSSSLFLLRTPRRQFRKTTVSIYDALPGETPSLYEMGLPIVETDDKWHLSVGQKVPLNRDRDNVRPAYLRAVRTLVLNEMNDRLTENDANATWVRQASSDSNCSPDAIKKVLDLRFGEKRAAYDPTDPEANKTWVSKGGTLVYGSMLNKDEWKNAKQAEAIQPAGHLCPTPKPYSDDPNAKPVTIIPQEQWTDGIRNIVAYAKFVGKELMGVDVTVRVVRTTNNFAACYGHGRLDFNVLSLGYGWFEHGANEEVDRLLIHEFGHQYSGDHLSEEYHEALCRLGAGLKRLALEKPESFVQFGKRKG